MPEVSVVIPTYNRANKIKRTVDSVLRQSFQDFEIIIIDDGSNDNTLEILKELKNLDQRISYICHELNKGAQSARNTGIRKARGKWIAFLDSDDYWLKKSLELRLNFARQYNYKVVHSDGLIKNTGAKVESLNIQDLNGEVYQSLLRSPGPLFQALLVLKSVLEEIELLDENIISFQEWDTSIRLAKKNEFGFLARPTFVYDCTGTDTISKDKMRDALGYRQIVFKHFSPIYKNVGLKALSEHFITIAFRFNYAGVKLKGLQYLILAFLFWPAKILKLRGWLFQRYLIKKEQ